LRDKARFKSYISAGKKASALPQQRRHAIELFLDTSQAFDFRLAGKTLTGRAYLASVGEGVLRTAYLVTFSSNGRIRIESSW
jgi:hypothetical protein